MRVGLGTTMIEPGLTGGRLDGIGVYTKALFEHLPEAGCQVHAYSYPRARKPQRSDITIGWPLPQSFERASLVDLLTPRERDVLRLLARGYAYKEIASELFISVKTVETHVSSVLRKTQLSNRYELSRWATDRRLV